MSLYLDASVLIPLFVFEPRSAEAQQALTGQLLIVSDFAVAEFSSGISRRVRERYLTPTEATTVFATFDAWTHQATRREPVAATDVTAAIGLVRRLDLGVRASDAINIAISQRCNADLFTFDGKMRRSARALGLRVVR